ncbi:MAG: hypothetical protein ACC683_11810 [Acidimicrobiia bacterium]
MELGLTTFTELVPGWGDGRPNPGDRRRQVFDEAVPVKTVGPSSLGSANTTDRTSLAPALSLVLAAIAGKTECIPLSPEP